MSAMVASISPQNDIPVIGEEAIALSEQIVRKAATVEARFCYLLLDPALRNPMGWLETTATEYGFDLRWASIKIGRNEVGRNRQPILVQLELDRYLDTEMCRVSAQMAVDDWDCNALRHGTGLRVGGWLLSSAELPELIRHLSGQAVRRRASEGKAWIRFHDPRVMDVLCDLYDTRQCRQLCGPVTTWLWLSRWRTLESLDRDDACLVDESGTAEPLSLEQWNEIDNIGPLNRLWLRAAYKRIEIDRCTLAELRFALMRARGYGFNDPADLAEFGWRALRVHRKFDIHPEVGRIIKDRGQNDLFSYVVADLDEMQWNVISEDMQRFD